MSMTFYGADARLGLNLADPPTALADEIARFVLDVDRYRVAGLAGMVAARLISAMGRKPGIHLDADKIKRMEGAPEIVAERVERVERVEFAPAETIETDPRRISDQRALADRRATGCQYDSGLCACPSAPYKYEGCRAR